MKAVLSGDDVNDAIDLGQDTRRGVLRAGRLYKKGVFTKIILESPVPTCGHTSGAGAALDGYWTLAEAGLVDRYTTPVRTADGEYGGYDTIYTITADLEFTDSRGNHWKQGDTDEWLK
jgi:hypothetical protein